MVNYFITCLKKYAVFSGRARRAEYWYFFLFFNLIHITLTWLDTKIQLGDSPDAPGGYPILGGFFLLALSLPYIAATTRRLHDVDKSGWWQLLFFVVIIGWIPLFVWAAKGGTIGPNLFGDDPKQEEHGTQESVDPDPPHPHFDIPESDPT